MENHWRTINFSNEKQLRQRRQKSRRAVFSRFTDIPFFRLKIMKIVKQDKCK